MFLYAILFLLVLLMVGVFALALTGNQVKQERLSERLKRTQATGDDPGLGLRDEEEMNKSLVDRVILPLAEKFSKPFSAIMPDGMVKGCERDIEQAGLYDKITGPQLTTISYLLMIGLTGGAVLLGGIYVATGKAALWMVLAVAAIAGILGYRLPMGIVQSKAKKRKHEIQKSLPFTFDLISISVEAGMAFDGAMATVAERTRGPLADELRRTLHEINLGIPRYDALNNLGNRVGVDDLKTFLTAVNYISKLGGSLVEVIKIQTEAMRVKRRQRAEKLAAQAPVKIMIPLVLFILPCIFIVVLGPPFMQAAEQMSQMNR